MILAGVGAVASRADACTIAGDILDRDELVSAFVKRSERRDLEGVRALLAESFTFRSNIDEKPAGKEQFLAWLQDQPPSNKDGIRTEIIDQSPAQVVQSEFVRFVDRLEALSGCGNLLNYERRIAVYDVIGYRSSSPPPVCLPGQACASDPSLKTFLGARIAALHHIALPFARAE